MKKNYRILHLGCGNSRLSFDLYEHGYKNITNVDFAASLISRYKEQYATSHPEMSWICSDIRDMSALPDASFDVVVEKATLDSLLVAEKVGRIRRFIRPDDWGAWRRQPALKSACHSTASLSLTDGTDGRPPLQSPLLSFVPPLSRRPSINAQ